MNFFRSKKLQEPRTMGRKVSLRTGSIARKLRFDPTMSESEIIEWLNEAKDNPQYSNITFDDVDFTNECLATLIQVLSSLAKRHQSYWDRLNLEFCRGPVDMIATTALLLDCVKHLFVASDGEDAEGLVVRLAAALQVNLSLKSIWLLIPLKLEAVRSLGQALAINDALNKLSLSGCKWDLKTMGGDDDNYDTDPYGTDTDDEYMDSSRFLNSDDDEEPEFGLDTKKKSFYTDPSIAEQVLQLPKAFAEGLRHNTSLRTFDLSCCELMDEVLAIILQALVGHPFLENLDISRNRAGRESIWALAELVGHPQSTLMTLNIGEQRKKSKRKGPTKVAKALRRTSQAEERNNHRGSQNENDDEDDEFDSPAGRDGLDLIPVSQALYNNETLQVLKLCHNRLTDDQVAELVRNLQGNESLQHLDLQFNCITTTGVKAITKGLSNLPALKELLLGGNDFGKEGNKLLAQLEDDDDSVCTIMESDQVDRKTEEDNETFHSARTSKSSGTATLRKSRASVPAAAGFMGGLTGIAQSRKSAI